MTTWLDKLKSAAIAPLPTSVAAAEVDTPAAISSDRTAYVIHPTARLVRLSTNNTSQRSINSIVAQPDRIVELWNIGPGPILFNQEDPTDAIAANRIATQVTAWPIMHRGTGATLFYDTLISRWRLRFAMWPVVAGGGVDNVSGGLALPLSAPARGQEAVAYDNWPSTQAQGTVATATSATFDVPTFAGRRYRIRAEAWVENGSGTLVYVKELITRSHNTAGTLTIPVSTTISESGTGYTFLATVSSANNRFTLANTSGATGTYNVLINVESADKP